VIVHINPLRANRDGRDVMANTHSEEGTRRHTNKRAQKEHYFLNSTRSKRQKQILLERPEGEGFTHTIQKEREKWMQLQSISIQPFPQTKVTNSITRNNFEHPVSAAHHRSFIPSLTIAI
jgi:hypothetical protein